MDRTTTSDADVLFNPDPVRDEHTGATSGRSDVDERTLYGDVPLPGDGEMFRPSTALRPAFLAQRDELLDAGFSNKALVERHRAFVSIAVDTGLPTAFIEQLYALDSGVTLHAMRPGDDDADGTPATDSAGWVEATRRSAREQYGVERGERYLGMVETFLAQHPTLSARLQTTGYRHHPEIVQGLIDHVRRLHE